MKIIYVLPLILMLSGCGWLGRGEAYITGYDISCIDGVVYYQFASGVTVAYNKDGGIKTCE